MTGSAMPGMSGVVPGSGAPAETGGVAPAGRPYAKGAAKTSGGAGTTSDGLFAALLTAALTVSGKVTTSPLSGAQGETGQASAEGASKAVDSAAPAQVTGDSSRPSAGSELPAEMAAASPASPPASDGTPAAQIPPAELAAAAPLGPEGNAQAAAVPEGAAVTGQLPGSPPGNTGQQPTVVQGAQETQQVVVVGQRAATGSESQDGSRLDRVFVEGQLQTKTGERQEEATAPDVDGAAGDTAETPQVAEAVSPASAGAAAGLEGAKTLAAAEAVVPGEVSTPATVLNGAATVETAVAPGQEAAPEGAGGQTGGEEQKDSAGERHLTAGSGRRSASPAVNRTPVQAHRSEGKEQPSGSLEAKVAVDAGNEAPDKPSGQSLAAATLPAETEGSAERGAAKATETGSQPALTAQVAVGKPVEGAPEARRTEPHTAARADLKELPELVRKAELVARTEGPSEMRLQLVPEHLGRLSVRVSVEEGVVTARLVVENPQVKALVEERLPELTRALQDQGLRLTNVSVGCENSGSNQHFQGWQGERALPREMAYGSARRGYDDLPANAVGMVHAAANHQWRGSGGMVDALV